MEKKIPKSVLAVMFVSVLSVCQTVSANELAKKKAVGVCQYNT